MRAVALTLALALAACMPGMAARAQPMTPDAFATAKSTAGQAAIVAATMGVFTYGTGSLVAGGVLTLFNVVKSRVLYNVNERAWDTYWTGADALQPGMETTLVQRFGRAGARYLTFKPVDTALKLGSIYLYTGSATTAIVLGSASSIASTGVYYLNDAAWELYGWMYRAPAAPAQPGPVSSR